MYRFMLLVLAIGAISACADSRPTDMRLTDETACKEYGLNPNTDAFALCIQNEVNARKQRDTTYSAANTAAIVWGD